MTNDRNSVLVFRASDHRCIAVNDAAVRSYGYARDEFLRLDAEALCAPGRACAVVHGAPGDERGTSSTAHRRKDGSEFEVDETVFDVDWDGVPASILLTSDVTERVQTENMRRADADAASRVHRLIAFGHWSTELATGVTTWSDEMWVNARVPKPPNSSSPGTGYDVVKRHMHPDDRKRVIIDFNDTATTGRVNRIEYRSFRGDGTMHWEEVLVAREVDSGGKPVRLVGTCIDITPRKEASERLALIARTDMLTGLANRGVLNERLAVACSAAKRRNSEVAVLFLDLNGFKLVNDSLGHAAGDLLLRSVATRLRALTRAEDLVARASGDEFVIVLEDPAAVSAAATAERILDGFRTPLDAGEHSACMSLSIGIACFPADGGDGETLMRNADTAMYQAKRTEGGAYRLFDPSMHEIVVHRFHLESGLREALRDDALLVHYQPVVAIDGRILGTEALVRWPQRGTLVPARDFIAIAEETGLVVPLDTFVLKEACRQNAGWQREGRPLTVAVNVSAQSLAHAGFLAGVRSALADSGLEPELLELELTERVFHGEPADIARTLGDVRALGVRIALDDFGTGYNSLAVLQNFRFDTVKLDRTFVSGIAANDGDRIIAAAVIFAAHGLGARVVAEGVETDEQRAVLESLGCEDAQGYYFGRPMAPAAFAKLGAERLPLRALGKVA